MADIKFDKAFITTKKTNMDTLADSMSKILGEAESLISTGLSTWTGAAAETFKQVNTLLHTTTTVLPGHTSVLSANLGQAISEYERQETENISDVSSFENDE